MNQLTVLNYDNELSAADVIEHAFQHYRGSACLTCSFQLEDMVVLHLLRRYQADIPVLFLDTGYHFPETYAYRDRMSREWNLNLINIKPQQSVADQESQFGILHQTDPGKCCHRRKVEPLFQALAAFELWFTGLRREQSPTRKNLAMVEQHHLRDGKSLTKVNPLVLWTWPHVEKYAAEHGIPPLPLYEAGYRSIGCEPCTAIPATGADPRSGRWAGTKLECGIHTFSNRDQ
jgi:phosphoadenosine phosphosulfate reductase